MKYIYLYIFLFGKMWLWIVGWVGVLDLFWSLEVDGLEGDWVKYVGFFNYFGSM